MNLPAPLARSFFGAALLLFTHTLFAAVAIRFEGIEDELEAAARNGLELQQYAERPLSATEVNRLFAQAKDQIRTALQPYGYYDAQVAGDLQRGEKEGDYNVIFRVSPGAPVLIARESVAVEGGAAEVPAIKQAIDAFRPKLGERLQHGIYEGSKANIENQLRANGYFDANLERHSVEVVQSARTADIDLKWSGGERYRFGDVNFSQVQFPKSFLQRYVPWKPDAEYKVDDLLALQQRLVDADYFSSVAVQPDLEHRANGRVPIEALLAPAKRTIYKAAAYVSTDSGPGVSVGMERRWLNSRGHKAGAEVEYSQRREAYSAFYRIPRPGERNRNYNSAIGYHDEETDSSRSRMAQVSAAEVLDRWHGFTRTLGLQYLNGDFEIADERRSTGLLYFDGLLTRKRADDLLFPRRGLSLVYGVRFAAQGLLSDTSLAQARGEAKWIMPASKQSRLLLRTALGAMTVANFDALPPELRFFAGGDRSIRGFDYQEIGEVNATGGVIGGKYLTVGSAEYEYYFRPNWGAAVFVDGGDAYSTRFDAHLGSGLGVRWRSPVGMVRLDLAKPTVGAVKSDGLRIHLTIGPDL